MSTAQWSYFIFQHGNAVDRILPQKPLDAEQKNKKHTGAGLGGDGESTAVTTVTVDDTVDSELITGVSCFCLAVTGGDDCLSCDVSCLPAGTCGLCVAAMPPSLSALIHKPQSYDHTHTRQHANEPKKTQVDRCL